MSETKPAYCPTDNPTFSRHLSSGAIINKDSRGLEEYKRVRRVLRSKDSRISDLEVKMQMVLTHLGIKE